MINIIFPKGDYINEDAIENVVNYALGSNYASNEKTNGNGVLLNDLQSITDSFYLIQKLLNSTDGQRIHHMVLTFEPDVFTNSEISEIAKELSNHIGQNFQNVYSVHGRSDKNRDHVHVHYAINSVSHNGNRLNDSFNESIRNCVMKSTNNEHLVKIIRKQF